MKSLIRTGRYLHYKGREYRVIGTARHSESEEILVIYHPLYGDQQTCEYWARPLDMFRENVSHMGATMPRFAWVGDL